MARLASQPLFTPNSRNTECLAYVQYAVGLTRQGQSIYPGVGKRRASLRGLYNE